MGQFLKAEAMVVVAGARVNHGVPHGPNLNGNGHRYLLQPKAHATTTHKHNPG